MNKKAYLILGIVLGMLFLFAAIRGIHFEELKQVFVHIQGGWLFPLLGSILFFFGLKAIRWKWLLEPVKRCQVKDITPSMMVGVASNYLLFAYLGDLIRTYLLHRQLSIRKSTILASVVLERTLDLLTVLSLLGITLLMMQEAPKNVLIVGGALAIIGLCALICFYLLATRTDRYLPLCQKMVSWLPDAQQDTLLQHIEMGVTGLRALSNRHLLAKIVTVSFLQWLFMGLCVYFSLLAMDIHVTFWAVFLIITLNVVGIALPNSPGHIGLVELCFVLGLKSFGVGTAQAFSAGLLYHAVFYISVMLVGFYYLRRYGLTFSQAKEKAEKWEKKKVLCVVGTRPEAIKMAPVIAKLKQDPNCDIKVLSTAQHREILDQMLDLFNIAPDADLNIMEKGQSLPQLTAKLPLPLDHLLQKEQPDLVLAQGDTTTAFMVSLACFYQKVPFGHVEAGLRTGDAFTPFPEEMNRVLISRLATLNFAPTEQAKQNLINEGYPEEKIFVTGNTVIDALHSIAEREFSLNASLDPDKRLILVTAHRRENFGEKLENICEAIHTLVENNPDIQILYPVHPNPKVREVVYSMLHNHPRIILTEPLPYEQFVTAMKQAYLILSDSGGVQEEAPALGTPVLVMREGTERPEGVTLGASKIVGTETERIVKEAQRLLDDVQEYQRMVVTESPFGDGLAAHRIVNIINDFLKVKSDRKDHC